MSIERTPLVSFSEDSGVHVIFISNGVNNSLNNDGLRDLLIAITDAQASADSPILITGTGERAFSMGYSADCRRISDKMHIREAYSLGTTIARAMTRSGQPIISAVNGFALGLGLEIALCSDIVICSDTARFGMPEVVFGIPSLTGIIPEIPDRFPGKVYSRVKSGKIFDAVQAKESGLVSTIMDHKNFIRQSIEYSGKVEPRLLRLIKSGHSGSQYRNIVDDLFFRIYDPDCLSMTQLERFRNKL